MDKSMLDRQLIEACFILFGPLYHFSYDKLKSINSDDLKSIYRKKALICHPDKARLYGKPETDLLNKFKTLNNAYIFLSDFIKKNINSYAYSAAEKDMNRSSAKQNFTGTRNENVKTGFSGFKQETNDFYYFGKLPYRIMRFGEFLFYSKKISWKTLINAIVHQYKNRPRFGELCLKLEYLNSFDITDVMRNLKLSEKFGEGAVRLKYLTTYQLFVILGTQKRYNYPIGKYFIENNFYTNNAILDLSGLHQAHNHRIKYRH